MTNAAEAPLAVAFCAAVAATAALAGAGATGAAGDPAQHEEIIRRETAWLDKSIAGIREEIRRLEEAPAGRPASHENGWKERRSQDRFDPGTIRISFLESEIERLEGLKADLGGHVIATMLAQGTANSVPSTEKMFFRVIAAPDVVTGFTHIPARIIRIDLEPGGGNRTIHIGIPAGLPHRGSTLDPALGHLLEPAPSLSKTSDVGYAVGECYTFISATVGDSSSIVYNFRRGGGAAAAGAPHGHTGQDDPHPESELRAKWLDSLAPPAAPRIEPHPVVSPAIPNGCGHVAIEPPFDPPLKQVRRDGILAETVACNEGLTLHVRGGDALCLRPETLDRLLASGILEMPAGPLETMELAPRRLPQ